VTPRGPALIVIRGNSGSGKSTTAEQVRALVGPGVAIVGQDHARRTVLKERDEPGALIVRLLDAMCRTALDGGYDVVLEGILDAGRYGAMILALADAAPGGVHGWYLDVPLDETWARHSTRSWAAEVGRAEFDSWYRSRDLVDGLGERVLVECGSAAAAAREIVDVAGLADAARVVPPHAN
jgi:hypothetical protein